MPGRPDPDLEVVLDAHAVLGEGPVWVGDRLWWVDIEGHRRLLDRPNAFSNNTWQHFANSRREWNRLSRTPQK